MRAVTIAGPGVATQSLEKVVGEWKSAIPGRQADETAIRHFFNAVAEVRAMSVASLLPADSMSLAGGTEIAFDMEDGTSLRRILTIGPRLEAGYQACVKGRDATFILSPETVSGLTRPLFLTEATAQTENPAVQQSADKDPK